MINLRAKSTKKRAGKYDRVRRVYVTDETTNLFYVKFLVSRL